MLSPMLVTLLDRGAQQGIVGRSHARVLLLVPMDLALRPCGKSVASLRLGTEQTFDMETTRARKEGHFETDSRHTAGEAG